MEWSTEKFLGDLKDIKEKARAKDRDAYKIGKDFLRALGFTKIRQDEIVYRAINKTDGLELILYVVLENGETLKKKKYKAYCDEFMQSKAKLLVFSNGCTYHFYGRHSKDFSHPIRVVNLRMVADEELVNKFSCFCKVNLLGNGLERLMFREDAIKLCENISYEVVKNGKFPSAIGEMLYKRYISSEGTPSREDINILCETLARKIKEKLEEK